jgi:sterol desaturase/sphingolipid hydroxylase (fatty acid hydroxylase superfamily)
MTALQTRLQQSDLVGLPDWRAAEILNAKDTSLAWVEQPIQVRDVLYHLMAWGVYGHLQFLAKRGEGQAAELAIKVLANIEPATAPFPTMDITTPEILAIFNAMGASLIQAGILTQAQFDFLWNLRMVPQSWAEVNGVEVTATTVGEARLSNG